MWCSFQGDLLNFKGIFFVNPFSIDFAGLEIEGDELFFFVVFWAYDQNIVSCCTMYCVLFDNVCYIVQSTVAGTLLVHFQYVKVYIYLPITAWGLQVYEWNQPFSQNV